MATRTETTTLSEEEMKDAIEKWFREKYLEVGSGAVKITISHAGGSMPHYNATVTRTIPDTDVNYVKG